MNFILSDGPLPIDENGTLSLGEGVVLVPADVQRIVVAYYRTAATGEGPGRFVEVPLPQVKITLIDHTEHVAEFGSGNTALVALGMLQQWRRDAAPPASPESA